MTRDEHLLTIAAEESVEVAQRLSKALRFGLGEVQPGQEETNLERIEREYYELRAVLGMCGIDAWTNSSRSKQIEHAKAIKVQQYLDYSLQCGTLTPRTEV